MYLNGECTEDEILQRFLNNFETVGIQDSVVSGFPAGKVRNEFGKNSAIYKYFGIHVKNVAIVTSKKCIY